MNVQGPEQERLERSPTNEQWLMRKMHLAFATLSARIWGLWKAGLGDEHTRGRSLGSRAHDTDENFASPPRSKVFLLRFPKPSLFADSPTSQGYNSSSDSSKTSRPVRYRSSTGDDKVF